MKHSHNHSHHTSIISLISGASDKKGKLIRNITLIGLVANIILMTLKLVTGWVGHSEALVADGFHSLNDIAADVIILLFIGVAYKKADHKYSYGYGKFETFASFLIGIILVVAAVMIFTEGLESIAGAINGEELERPDIWTVIVAIFAIIIKECLFRLTSHYGKKTGSSALIANAWHHRSDALATIATLIGVTSAHFLGEQWRILDPCASLLIAVFIIVPAIRIVIPAFRELMEKSLPAEVGEKASMIITQIPGVVTLETLKSRKSGHFMIFDATVGINPSLNIEEGFSIAENIRERLEDQFGKHIMVGVNTVPARRQTVNEVL